MFTRQTDRLADAVRLLSAMAAFAHRPDVKGGLSLYDAAKEVAAQPPPSLKTLADDLTRSARETLQRYPDAPADAETLYEQMVVQALLTDAEIVAENLDPARCTVAMQAKLTDREHKTGEMPRLFAAITEPALGPLLKTTEYTADLTPAYRRRVLEGLTEIRDEGRERGRILENVSDKLDHIEAQTRDTLEALAIRFGESAPEAMSLPDLRAFLIEKAKDYKRTVARVAALDEREGRLSNLRSEAEAAVADLRLDDAKRLLRDAKAIQNEVTLAELEKRAAVIDAEAEIALLEGDADAAFRHYEEAAAAIAPLDRLVALHRRNRDLQTPYYHGSRYGGTGLARAIEIGRLNLVALDQAQDADIWAATQVHLGNALREQGSRTGGEAGARLLAEAVAACRAALRVTAEADHPVDWAVTQNNLGVALAEQGTRTGGEAGARLLAEAVEAFRAALRVTTEAEHPVHWAGTQNNLGSALRAQGRGTGGEAGARLLAEAVAAYRAALRVSTEADHPVNWAGTQNNLGTALREQGSRTCGEAGAGLLAEAVAAYRAALRVSTEADHPVNWAGTQNNLGAALRDQGSLTSGRASRRRLFAEAEAACRAALRVYTEYDQPVDWARATLNLGTAHAAMAENETCADSRAELARAAECVEAALRVYYPEHMPYYHAMATAALERIRNKLAEVG